MRKLLLILGAGALALAGTAALAAGGSTLHTMTVKLPDGGVAKIEYSGNVAPKVDIRAGSSGDFAAFAPSSAFSGFPNFAKIEAVMDRQMNDMLREARAMMAMPATSNAPFEANFGALPQDSSSWFVSTGNGANFCARSVEVTVVNGKKTVRSHTEGNCGPAKGEAAGAAHSPAAPAKSI
jgi:hypothetical protein